jgi:hypothetical protein
MNAVSHFGGHRELRPVGAVKALARHEAIKIIASLLVAGRLEGEGADGASDHCIVVLCMGLHVLTILNATVFVVVDSEPGDDCAGAERLGDAQLMGESVEPKKARKTISMIMRGGKCSNGAIV